VSARRAATLFLLLIFGAVALVPVPLENIPGASELRKRGDAVDPGGDAAVAARKPAPESVTAALKRPSAPSLRRMLLAVGGPAPSLVLQPPARTVAPTAPSHLREFRSAHPNALRAPPV